MPLRRPSWTCKRSETDWHCPLCLVLRATSTLGNGIAIVRFERMISGWLFRLAGSV
jgi:hypothetical protein